MTALIMPTYIVSTETEHMAVSEDRGGFAVKPTPAGKWSPEQVRILRREHARGLTHAEIAPLVGKSPNAVAQKVRHLEIQAEPCKRPPPPLVPTEPQPEPSIPYFVHHQAVTDYRTWDQQRHCYINNHLYREPVSLAAVW